ncbi:MAG: alpha/beta fold hydrolase [Alphaproteobacteria bacterium]|nr:alpha/beta fold hydrolase [Alphaproteobacteria bacterium]
MTAFVLVHGAWHGGWCWVRVAERLAKAGHRVFTPTLTGLGERAHLLSRAITLDTHIADICGVFESEELTDAVLVGHSLAGMIITPVADRLADRIGALVYLDAFLPRDGECHRDLVDPERAAQARRIVDERGDGWLVPPRSAEAFGVRDAADRAWIDRRCTPQPFAVMEQKISLTGAWERIPRKIYIRAGAYANSPFGRFAERCRDDPAWRYEEIACGHEIMVEKPDELAAILLELA